MPEPTQPPGKKRVSTTALVILCGLLLLLSLAAVIFPVVREVRFIERMESEGFWVDNAASTKFEGGPFDRWRGRARRIDDYESNQPKALPSLRPLRNSPNLTTIDLKKTPMTQDHLAQLGVLKNLGLFELDSQVTPDFATRLPRHFPNLEYFRIPLDSDNIEALSRTPVTWRQNIDNIACQPSSVLDGNDIGTLVDAFPNLMDIDFNGSYLKRADLTILANKPFNTVYLDQSKADLSQLRGCEMGYLSLRDNQYESADLAPLAGSRINGLNIGKNPLLDDQVVPTLLAIKTLQVLSLEGISLTADGYAILAKHPSLKNIYISPKPPLSEPTKALLKANKIHVELSD